MSAIENLKQANEARERELQAPKQTHPPLRSLTEAANEHGESCGNCGTWRRLVDDYFIEKCRHCGDDETYIFEVEKDDVPIHLDSPAASFAEPHPNEAKEWIVVATVVGPGPLANRFYWTRDDPGYSSHPELAMRLTREKAEYIADDNNREGFSAYGAKWRWTVETVSAG